VRLSDTEGKSARPNASAPGAPLVPKAIRAEELRSRTKNVFEKRRNQMKPSTKDQVQGDLHELKGKVKEKAGQVTNNPNLEAEGQAEKIAGKVQKKVGQVEKLLEK